MLQIFAIIDDTSVMNFRKNLLHNFPKMRGGGARAVWNFSEKSSILEGEGVPKFLQSVGRGCQKGMAAPPCHDGTVECFSTAICKMGSLINDHLPRPNCQWKSRHS